jgi:transaldolase
MKIFLDTADVQAIAKASETGLVDGITTNPTKILETGRPFIEVIKEICSIIDGPVSAEAVAVTADDLVREAVKIAALADNVAIKVPMTPDGLIACARLREKNIIVNTTMVFSPDQALLAMKAGTSFVSLVLSRLDKIGGDPYQLVEDTIAIKHNYQFRSEILAASIKSRDAVIHCMRSGCDIISIPETLFYDLFKHPLTESGLAGFDKDWDKLIDAGLV